MRRLLVPPLLAFLSATSAATTYSVRSYYGADNGAPYFVHVQESRDCVREMQSVGDGADIVLVECTTNYFDSVQRQFGVLPYILRLQFDSSGCSRLASGFGVPLSNKCEGSLNVPNTKASIGSLNINGSASIRWFSHGACSDDSWLNTDTVDQETLKTHTCDVNWRKWYSSGNTRRLMLESLSTSGGNNISATSTNSTTTSGNSISSDTGNENTSVTIGTSTSNATNSNTNTSVTVGTSTTSNSNEATNATDDVNSNINVNSTPAPTPTSSASNGGSNSSISTPATSTDNSGGSSTTAATNTGGGSSNVGTTAPTINTGNGSTGVGSTSSLTTNSDSEGSNVAGDSSSLIVADSRSGSNAIVPSPTSSGSGVVIGITCGCIAAGLVACALIVFVYRRRDEGKPADDSYMRPTTTASSGDLTMTQGMMCGQTGLWTDDIITAKRISHSKVQVRNLISQGGYGEVYAGVFHGRSVAVKMLLPATRTDIKHVNNFLAEAKMVATMNHPHIVSLVGIAWDSLSDLCVVFEFMEGGDLRSLLDKYQQAGHPVGLDNQKATIAIHICHALTYLHSLSPSIIHRDLKSRDVLLNCELEAKLTDFGVSRERRDGTMTAGVGTSLWMAPEMMMGERYDDKANIFSLGVLLSELDMHTLPYAREKQTMSDAVLLHRIATGTVRVSFSPYSPREFQDLGHACVSVNPDDRPTAAEVLYRLQVVLLKCLASSESDGLENSEILGSVLSYTI